MNDSLRELADDLAKHGLRADLTPTVLFGDESHMYRQLTDYLQRLDKGLRERAKAALDESTGDWRDGYEAACDDTERSHAPEPHDCLTRLAEITHGAAWPLSLLSSLIEQRGRVQQAVPTPSRVGPPHSDVHLVDGACWCNCTVCTTSNGVYCICPDCNGSGCGHEDRTAVLPNPRAAEAIADLVIEDAKLRGDLS